MKKIFIILGLFVAVGSLLITTPAKATDPVVDQQFTPNYNNYGRYNSVFLRACTRFKPTKSTYATYFDLAVKNDQGINYPIRASFRTAVSDTLPSETIYKYFIQTTFNNYAMSEGFSRFTAEDGQNTTMDTKNNYFICIEDLVNNNATGWFYTNPASGKYSLLGFTTDVPTYLNDVSFGFRTYGYDVSTDSSNTGTSGNTTQTGSSPSNNTSSSISKPTGLTATYSATAKAVSLTWKASPTTTVTGYNLYRSETSGKSYTKVTSTTKTTLTYNDTGVTAGKTYYYVVRAYQGTAESSSSNESSVVVPSDAVIATTTPTHKIIDTSSSDSGSTVRFLMTPYSWALLGLALVLLALLGYLLYRRYKKPVNK